MKLIIIKDFPLTKKKILKASPHVVDLHDDTALRALAGGYAERYPRGQKETRVTQTTKKKTIKDKKET